MAEYRFELGIDWDAILRPNAQAFLQTAFVDVASSTVTSPVNLQEGDTVAFVIFDTTPNVSPTQTGSLDFFWMDREGVSAATLNTEPFPATSFNPSDTPTSTPSIAFGDTYPMWDTGMVTTIGSNTGRWRLTITITATNTDNTAMMTWSDDPEMVVGEAG